MEESGHPERSDADSAFGFPRGFLVFMAPVAGWSFYTMLRHPSARFLVPHYLVMSFAAYGRVGRIIDLCVYLLIWMLAILVKSARNTIERAWWICWIGPILLNPLKILIPIYAYIVWWAELFLTLIFFLATIALLLEWKPNQTLARCRARFNTTTELPPAPKP
jgi:hypothetical protein